MGPLALAVLAKNKYKILNGHPKEALDLTGQTYNSLKVLELAPWGLWSKNYKGKKERSWWCQCLCGLLLPKPVTTREIRHGHKKSCGCQHGGFTSMQEEVYRNCQECGQSFRLIKPKHYFCNSKCCTNFTKRRVHKEKNELRFLGGLTTLEQTLNG